MSWLRRRLRALVASLRRAHAADPRRFRAQAGLALLLFALVLHLLTAPYPWRHGVGERLAEGKPLRPLDWVRTYGWWASAGNALLVAALLASLRRWLGPAEPPPHPALATPGRAPAWFWVAVAAATATSAALAWPRLDFGWAPDEEATVVRYIDGSYERRERGLAFESVTWEDTFWNARTPNNHVPLSVLSRLSLALWRSAADPPLEFASERAVRMPAFLAGVASVGMTALFLRRLGLVAAGAAAAWLLALHPWHMRYASEARGYALLLLLIPVTWLALLAALERGTWRRWILYGLSQSLLLWSHAGVVWELAVTNAAALAALFWLHRHTPRLREQAARFAVTSALSAGVYLQLMLPGLVQIAAYLRQWQGDTRGFGDKVLWDALAHLGAGVAWRHKRGEAYLELAEAAVGSPILFATAAAATVALLLAGAARLARSGGVRALLVPVLLLPGPLVYAAAWLRHDRFYPFYLVFALPGLAALVAAGVTWPPEALRSPRARSAAGAALVTAYLLLFGWLGSATRAALRAGAIDPTRDSVLVTRGSLNPFTRKSRRILTAHVYRPAQYYDPLGHDVRHVEALQKLMVRADERGVPLFVNQARSGLAARRLPALVRFVARDDLFETVAIFPGWEPENERIVRRYRGRARSRR